MKDIGGSRSVQSESLELQVAICNGNPEQKKVKAMAILNKRKERQCIAWRWQSKTKHAVEGWSVIKECFPYCSPSGFQAIPATGLMCPSRASGSLKSISFTLKFYRKMFLFCIKIFAVLQLSPHKSTTCTSWLSLPSAPHNRLLRQLHWSNPA